MKVTVKDNIVLGEIKSGSIFKYGWGYYLRTDDVIIDINNKSKVLCMHVLTGETTRIDVNERVELMSAELIIEGR